MFAKPRAKKPLLTPQPKKRKTVHTIEEISFDNDAREEYLTGFHKRKQQRIKFAQEEAAKRERQERIESRKQLREDRKREVEEHVTLVKKMLQESGAAGHEDTGAGSQDEDSDGWDGFPDQPNLELIDHEEEYIDEDRYTMVTVETVNVSRDGLEKPTLPAEDEDSVVETPESADATRTKQVLPKKKKPKFRYESKLERKVTDRKQRARHKAKR